jgi:light-regulated signal transduction histidine kinase (bacteriophytochrome)
MNDTTEIQTNEDLAFFGRINASISHELKNIFAIISETSGLLTDLVDLAEKGNKADLKMFKNCSRDIEEEIQRGFATVKAMNRFSHSVDDTFATLSVVDVLKLVVTIAGYLSYACKIKMNIPENNDFVVSTRPFRLQHLIYQALVFAFKKTGPEGEIHLSVVTDENDGLKIVFSNLGDTADVVFPVEEIMTISQSIRCRVSLADDFQSFEIIVPNAI